MDCKGLGEEVGKVVSSFAYVELLMSDAIAEPVVAYIYCFGSLDLDVVVGNPYTAAIVAQQLRNRLCVDEAGSILRFGDSRANSGDDAADCEECAVDSGVVIVVPAVKESAGDRASARAGQIGRI